jgi:nitroreductase
MENFLQLCQQRFSLRAYKPEKVSAEVIDYIMECVRMAPSAVNKQPWRFRLLTSPEDLSKVQQCYNRSWFATAPACFLVCRHRDEEWVRSADGKPHGDIDVAIAVEHLCLAAAEKGLGTCWVCNFDITKCINLFPVPNNLEPVALIPIGLPQDVPTEKKRKSLSEIRL